MTKDLIITLYYLKEFDLLSNYQDLINSINSYIKIKLNNSYNMEKEIKKIYFSSLDELEKSTVTYRTLVTIKNLDFVHSDLNLLIDEIIKRRKQLLYQKKEQEIKR